MFCVVAAGVIVGLDGVAPQQIKTYQARLSYTYSGVQTMLTAPAVPVVDRPAVTAPLDDTADGQTPLGRALAISTVRPPIGTYIPAAPQGWTARPTAPADYRQITGTDPINWSETNPAIAKIEAEMATHVAEKIAIRDPSRNLEKGAVTFQAGPKMAMISLQYLPDRVFDGADGFSFGLLQELMRSLCTAEYAAEEFATIDGVPVEISFVSEATDARRINVYIGPQIDLEIYTNADDGDIRAILSGFDFPALNALLAEPLPEISRMPHDAAALSTQ
ncbi:hypothetical protein [Yoonia sp. SS1-5]|uniref:Uncharacterized protein n=1 Tax=Yoonia rhodophyticola TaxID=3137370 RepID=A0AAN0NII1_9RHOB